MNKNNHYEYMKMYSKYRNIMNGGVDGNKFYQMIFSGEFIDIIRWLEDYREKNPDYPKDNEIPECCSVENNDIFNKGDKMKKNKKELTLQDLYKELKKTNEQLEKIEKELEKIKENPFVKLYPIDDSEPKNPTPLPTYPVPSFPKIYDPIQNEWNYLNDDIPCMHKSCPTCGGTGMRKDGLGACIHMISCPCPKCTPRY